MGRARWAVLQDLGYPRVLGRLRGGTFGPLVVCALAATYLATNWIAFSQLYKASDLSMGGRHTEAVRVAESIERPPASVYAALIRAESLVAQGKLLLASGAYADVAIRAPNDWTVRRDWAILERRLAQIAPPRFKPFRLRRARRQMAFARQLNPLMPLPRGFSEKP